MEYSKLKYDESLLGSGFVFPKFAHEIYERGGEPTSALDFYDDVFRAGDLEPHRLPEDYRTGEYGAIALEVDGKKAHRITVTDGLEELIDLIDHSENFCMIAPVSYAGKRRTIANARYLHALCIEIDGIQEEKGIDELFYCFRRENWPIPRPTYIVCSGNGLHLYWVFERPIPLFKNIFQNFSEVKQWMTRHLWDKPISKLWERVQYESLVQAFRCVGTRGKKDGVRALAFKVGDKVTIESMNARLPENHQLNVIYKTNLTLQQAKELYPKWYQRRIVEGKGRDVYYKHRGVYDDWKRKVYRYAVAGHRYFCLENLCSLAVQCQIPPEEVEKDVREMAEFLETKTNDDDNHFTEYDVLCAMATYDKGDISAFKRKTEYISVKTGVPITPNKRNGRKQDVHLKIARFTRDLSNENWRNKDGAPTKQAIVEQWQAEHPNGKKADCIRDTGLTKPTVYKWWQDRP